MREYPTLPVSFAALFPAILLVSSFSQAATSLSVVATYDVSGASTVHTNSSGNALSSTALNDVAGFKSAVATAHGTNTGGVIDFGSTAATNAGDLNITYGGGKKFTVTSQVGGASGVGQSIDVRSNLGTLSPISGTTALLITSGNAPRPTSWSLSFGAITLGSPGEAITTAAFTLLSRDGFASDVTVNWFINGSSTPILNDSENIAIGAGVDNTFFSYTAPAGSAVTGFQVVFGSDSTDNDRRLGIDDIGFITGIVPEPGAAMLAGLASLAGLVRRRRM